MVCHGPSGWDLIGCWPAIFSCSPCQWLKKSRSSLCGCAPFSFALIPVCLQCTTGTIIKHHLTFCLLDWPKVLFCFVFLFCLGKSSQSDSMLTNLQDTILKKQQTFFMAAILLRKAPLIVASLSRKPTVTKAAL